MAFAQNSTTQRGKHKRDLTLYLHPSTFDVVMDACGKTNQKRSALIEDILRLHFNLPPV